MQEMKYQDLETRATELAKPADDLQRLTAMAHVRDTIDRMRESGEALTLTDEEQRMLQSFRRFKLRMKKNGEVFKWQTAVPLGVQVVSETANIVMPEESEQCS